MYYTTLDLSKRITLSTEAINLAETDQTLGDRLLVFGLTPERLSEGRGFIDEAFRLLQRQQVEYGMRIETTQQVIDLADRVRKQLVLDRQVARFVFLGNTGMLEQMRLRGRITSSREGLLVHARHVYQEILGNAEALAALAPFALTTETLTARLALVGELAAAMEAQQRQRAEAKIRTEERREAMQALDDWMGEFIRIARVAFRGQPSQLEKLGIHVRVR